MSIVLWHGTAGWTVAFLAITGALWFLSAGWERFHDWLDLGTFRRRDCRPGVWVRLPDGRCARVLYLYRDRELAGPWAVVQPHDEDQQALPALMVPVSVVSRIEYEEAMA